MPSKTLLTYIQTELAKGMAEASIRAQCLSAGWSQSMVDDAFAFLNSIQNGPGSATALALEKMSRLIPLIRLGFGILCLNNLYKLLTLLTTVFFSQKAMIDAAKGVLPAEYFSYLGWYPPVFISLEFVASFLCLHLYLSIPQRNNLIWKKSLFVLFLLLIMQLIIWFLGGHYVMQVNNLTNNY